MPAPRKYRRPRRPLIVEEGGASRRTWIIAALLLLSLLLHALIVLAFLMVGRRTPPFPVEAKEEKPPEVSLVIAEPPPQRRPDFFPTEPQANAPDKPAPFISDNNNALQSQNRTARNDQSALPDVTGHKDHSATLHSKPPSPLSKPQPATPPAPQNQQQPQTRQNTAKPNDVTKPSPPEPNALRPTDHPEQGKENSPQKPSEQEVDANGLPVLPPISAPTLAPQTPTTQQVVPRVQQRASPQSVPSFAVYQSDVSGAIGQPGTNSPAAMATDLGRYKAKVYRAVGARWYQKVNDQIGVLGVGTVHITYTIYSDGRLEIRADPDAGNTALMILHSLSLNSMTEAAPFDPFSDKMKKEVGDSYTDDFTFSIYGN